MRYFQTMPVQLQREIFRYPVTKLVFLFGIFIFLMSCKTLKTNRDNYNVINAILDTYVKQDSIYLHPEIVILNNKKIEEFKTYGIDIDSCNPKINDIISSRNKLISENNNGEEKWDYSKITNPKVFTCLDLKRPESIARYKKLSETIKDEYDLLARKFMLWKIEHNEGMVQLSYPFFNTDNSYALVHVSKYNDGQFVLILKKLTEQKWEVICKKRLSHY